MKVDFIIVGQGIAGTSFAYELLRKKKSFIIIDCNDKVTSSKVALGVYNPLVLKWFSKVWNIDAQLAHFYSFYNSFSKFLNKKIVFDIGIYKYLDNSYQQNNWMVKSGNLNKMKYMSSNLLSINNSNLNYSDFYGLINHAGRIDISSVLTLFYDYCIKNNFSLEENFSYSDLEMGLDSVKYKGIESKNIIFCEGYRALNNPFFNLSIIPTKGEVLKIFSKDLKLNQIIHSGGLIVPLGDNKYAIGSTYIYNNQSYHVTNSGKDKLTSILNSTLNCNYQIISYDVGIRPATKDRKAILGRHSKYSNMYILNGLGSRGVLLAPYLSMSLINNIYDSGLIDKEVKVYREQKSPN